MNINNMNNKLCLGICEIFHPQLHGYTDKSDPNINGHYLIHTTIDLDEFFDSSYEDCLENLLDFYHERFGYYNRMNYIEHPIIRNYNHILNNIENLNLEIIEVIELSGNEQCASIKTFWLKLLQRRWKRIYKESKNKIEKLKNYHILKNREITGLIK